LLTIGISSVALILITISGLTFLLRKDPPEQETDQAAPAAGIEDSKAIEERAARERKEAEGKQRAEQLAAEAAEKQKREADMAATEKAATESTQSQSLTVEEVASRTEASIAYIEGETGTGTGFLIHDGILATNRHVINGELVERLKIHFPSAPAGQQGPFTAELIYKDPNKDLAFLKVETSLPPLTLPAQHSFRRGQEVIVIGNPGIGNQVLKNAVNTGVLSTEVTVDGQAYYQLGLSINGGNSGGPVLDMSGQVLGVATLNWKGTDGLAACVPVPQLTEALAKAQNLSESEIATIRSQHRLGVVVWTVSNMAHAYQNAMRKIVSIAEASKSEKSDSIGLQQVRDEVRRIMIEDRWLVDADLSRESTNVSSDSNIPDRIRGKFVDLWTNYKEMKSNVENPRGTLETFRTKFLQLSDQHDRLMHALNLHLGIKEE